MQGVGMKQKSKKRAAAAAEREAAGRQRLDCLKERLEADIKNRAAADVERGKAAKQRRLSLTWPETAAALGQQFCQQILQTATMVTDWPPDCVS